MPPQLLIEARLPRPAGLELSARLLAARPHWDVEVEEDGLNFVLTYLPGALDSELMVLEEACRNLERTRSELEVELKVSRVTAESVAPLGGPLPAGFGPWRLISAETGEDPLSPGHHFLNLPEGLRASGRWQAGETLLLTALAEYLSPPPGAPETRGCPTLALESFIPLAPAAAVRAGSGPVTLLTDEAAGSVAADLARLNHPTGPQTERPANPPPAEETESPLTAGDGALPLWGLEIISGPFKTLARKRSDWAGHFGLIAVHLSPYLAARRLKTLAGWLRPEGVLIVSGFNPGPQTAHLLRAAARAGLSLAGSVAEGDWAALKLEPTLARPELPPLTGSLVPDLVDLPPVEEFPNLEVPVDEAEAIPEDEGLMLAEDEDEAEEEDE